MTVMKGFISCGMKNYSYNRLKGVLAFFMCMCLFCVKAHAGQCPRCGGSGKQLTIPEVGNYGVERHKKRCPVCGDMVFSPHYDVCKLCGGNGSVDGNVRFDGNSAAEASADKGREFLMANLTMGEYGYLQSMLASMFATRTVYETCYACNGNKVCPQCGGVQNFSIDVDESSLCRLCGGGGLCVRCNGTGFTGKRIERVYSQEEIDKISRNCGVIISLAQIRSRYNLSPGQKDGPYIDMDDDGVFFIKNNPSDVDGISGSVDGDVESGTGNTFDIVTTEEKGRNSTVWILVVLASGISVMVGVFCVVKRRKRRPDGEGRRL